MTTMTVGGASQVNTSTATDQTDPASSGSAQDFATVLQSSASKSQNGDDVANQQEPADDHVATPGPKAANDDPYDDRQKPQTPTITDQVIAALATTIQPPPPVAVATALPSLSLSQKTVRPGSNERESGPDPVAALTAAALSATAATPAVITSAVAVASASAAVATAPPNAAPPNAAPAKVASAATAPVDSPALPISTGRKPPSGQPEAGSPSPLTSDTTGPDVSMPPRPAEAATAATPPSAAAVPTNPLSAPDDAMPVSAISQLESVLTAANVATPGVPDSTEQTKRSSVSSAALAAVSDSSDPTATVATSTAALITALPVPVRAANAQPPATPADPVDYAVESLPARTAASTSQASSQTSGRSVDRADGQADLPGAATAAQPELALSAPPAPAALQPSTPTAAPVYSSAELTQQIAEPVLNLRASGDGAHRIVIQLHPQDLGSVGIEVSVHNGALSMSVSSASESTRATIAAALPALHQQLADAGISAVKIAIDSSSVNTSGGGASGGQQNQQQWLAEQSRTARTPSTASLSAGSVSTDDTPAAAPTRQLSTTGVDRWL